MFAVASWLLPFAIVLYLSLRGGGFESVVRDQAAVVLWLIIVVGAATGFLPAARTTRWAWVALGLLTAFGAWTALSAIWSESVERSLDTVPLIGAYLAVLLLGVMVSTRETFARVISAVAAAIGVVAVFALLARFVPGWFPADETLEAIPDVASRLKYPLGSWNGLAAFLAMGVPILLAVAVDARTVVARALAAAALPAVALAISYTLSRSGIAVAVIGIVVFVALHPRRMAMAPAIAVIGLGAGLLLLAATGFDDLKNLTQGEESQRAPMAAITFVLCALTGLGIAGLTAAEHRDRIRHFEIPARISRRLRIAGGIALACFAIGVLVTGEASDAWERFKAPDAPVAGADRLASGSGNQRYQQWEAAVDAAEVAPLGGKGAGTYEYWWARNAEVNGYSRYAHSLYLETLAETGIVGFALIVSSIVLALVAGVRLARQAAGAERGWLSGATACLAVFALAMALDWSWNIPAIPVAALLVLAAVLGSSASPGRGRWPMASRLAIGAGGLVLVAVALISWLGAQRVVDSQQAVRAGNLEEALDAAISAESLQPYAATPHLQQALVLEAQGDYDAAAFEAGVASAKDPFNWEPRWVLSRIEELGGNLDQAASDFDAARQLNPRSPFFTEDRDESALTPLE